MRIKQLFANLGIALALGAVLLPASVFATGADEPKSPDQSQSQSQDQEGESDAPDHQEEVSSDNTSIGGGLNIDTVEQPPVSNPQPSTPGVSQTLPQPSDPDAEVKQPTPAAPMVKPTLPAVTSKPQTSSKPNPVVLPTTSTTPDTDSTEAPATSTIIPAAPNDNVAPTEIEAPHTGLVEKQSAPVNPLAVILLILAGITILAAGIVSSLLSKAAQRNQSTI